MLPKLFSIGGYHYFFWSNEQGEPVHVHICKGKLKPYATKIWITRSGNCIVAHNRGRIPKHELSELIEVIQSHHLLIISMWKDYFDTIKYYV